MGHKKKTNRNELASGGRAYRARAQVAAFEYDIYRDQDTFKITVLSRPVPISTKDTKAVLGGNATSDDKIEKFAFKGRVLGKNSMHIPLDDPCNLAWGADKQTTAKLISEHTTFISSDGYVGKIPSVGDTVEVILRPGDYSYNLQYAYFTAIRVHKTDKSTAVEFKTDCTRLKTKFNAFKAQRGGTVGKLTTPVARPPGAPPGAGGTPPSGVKRGARFDYHQFPKDTSSLAPSARGRFEAWLAEMTSLGYKYKVTSVRRSVKHQWCLYMGKAHPGYCSVKGAVGQPCGSGHQYGFAMDMNWWTPDGKLIPGKNVSLCNAGLSTGCKKNSAELTRTENLYKPIAAIANKHNISWWGDYATNWYTDAIHWIARTSADRALQSKRKAACYDYFYGPGSIPGATYTSLNMSKGSKSGGPIYSWPETFPDVLVDDLVK